MRPRRALGRFTLQAALAALVATGLGGCRDRQPKPLIDHAAVVRCERGVQHAGAQPSLDKAMGIYYRSCADIHAQPACRQAFVQASKAPGDQQMRIVIDGCKKAYCSTLGAGEFEICRPDFKATAAGVNRAWPPFHAAIIKHDAKALESRVSNALLSFYLKTQKMPKTEAEVKPPASADAGAAAADGATPAGSAAPPASAAPAGSVPPPPSAAPPAPAVPAASAPKARAPAAPAASAPAENAESAAAK